MPCCQCSVFLKDCLFGIPKVYLSNNLRGKVVRNLTLLFSLKSFCIVCVSLSVLA